ncbi:putative nuclease HARBI1 [Achroia grisella]|uniref:putative nuclease HARBI1 n=1 Tax=Achroia grisella TaxID=688607 RepID=UPI0027D26276|nr:putative nuclease HARBI1 [Achroia grisella]
MARAILLAFAEEERKKNAFKRARRLRREVSDPLGLSAKEFEAQFRLTKEAFNELCREVIPLLRTRKRSTMIRDELKIAAALTFFACGAYQRGMGNSSIHNMSQPSFSHCLEEVTNALNSDVILKKYIKFPSNGRVRDAVIADFKNISGMPGVIGCVGGTHIAIVKPVENANAYLNSKLYHSLNVLAICDSHMNITYIDASYGGAAHDNFIWTQSPIKNYLERLNLNGDSCWLLGDSGFTQKAYMMTPILKYEEGSPEEYYTKIHHRTHSIMQRCIVTLKSRWKCLLPHRVLHYNPAKAGKIVNACAVLNNIANSYNIAIPKLSAADEIAIERSQLPDDVGDSPNTGRSMLVQLLWAARRE